MRKTVLFSLKILLFSCLLSLSEQQNAQNLMDAVQIQAEVDASSLPQRLLYSTLTIPVQPGKIALWYPQYIPGIHGPGYQLQNIGGLEIYATGTEKRLVWKRDEVRLYKIYVTIPPAVNSIQVKLTYIANQPTRTSRGVDTFGNAWLLALNFNTCLMYLDNKSSRQTLVALKLKLPTGWQFGSSLIFDKMENGWHLFEPETLEDLVDSPLIAGRFFKTLKFKVKGFPKGFMHLVSESPKAIEINPKLVKNYQRLFEEASKLFGYAPFSAYHFLVICSDRIPSLGLEHLSSSLNSIGERDLLTLKKQKGWAAYLLPHEFVHAWCGKFRRPLGMFRTNFHEHQQTKLLWIYEGLTQYLGEILTVRSGLLSFEDYLARLTHKINYLKNRTGRRWRSLEDTAICAHTLRGRSKYWSHLRRDQDYYNEGVLFWMEVDAILREKSNNEKSIDTFCKIFFGSQGLKTPKVSTFQLKDITEILHLLEEHDWEQLIETRIQQPMEELSLDFLEKVGYQLTEVSFITPVMKAKENERNSIYATESLGIILSNQGEITQVIPGSIAHSVGLIKEMKIIGIEHKKFSRSRFNTALKKAKNTKKLDFLIQDGDSFRTFKFKYNNGLKYLKLERNSKKKNYLKDIFQRN